jgi:hypothetical protein
MNPEPLPRLPRRAVLKMLSVGAVYLGTRPLSDAVAQNAPVPETATVPGYGSDPNVTRVYAPGDLWPLTFDPLQRRTAVDLADVIFPADHFGPAASTLRVADYIDEWISAPYPVQKGDRTVILEGLAWLEGESQTRFKAGFEGITSEQQRQICDDIAWAPTAQPQFRKAAHFFHRFRNIAAGAYYGTAEGWKAIGYIGNQPMQSFPGPPPEVLERLGLEQTIP